MKKRVWAVGLTFHGNVPHGEVLRILGRGHLFLFPTRVKEGFPKAVLEALACGLPVLAPPVSVLPRLLGNGAGLLLSEPNEEALAEGVLRLAADPESMQEHGAKGPGSRPPLFTGELADGHRYVG